MSYFTEDEFKCSCQCGMDITPEFKRVIAEAREIAGIPFVINSGARCKYHNSVVGGKDTSSHTKGIAVDIMARTSRERYLICHAFNMVGVTRFGVAKTFVHVDIDEDKSKNVTWLY